MARAAIYYYEPGTSSCIFCHRETARGIDFHHRVSDLFEKTVSVPVHPWCYRMRIAGFWLLFALALVVMLAILGLAEAAVFYGAGLAWVSLPWWLWAADGIAALFVAALIAIRSYSRFYDRINHFVQLRTFPVD